MAMGKFIKTISTIRMNKTIGVVITDGVGYRNFVMSDFIKEVSKEFENVIIYSGIPKESYNFNLIPSNVKIIDLSIYRETNSVWFFRKIKETAHMYKFRSFFGINDNLVRGYPKTNSKRGLLIKLVYKIARIFHAEKHILFFEKIQFRIIKKSEFYSKYIKILAKDKLDVLFFTHQRPPFLAPLLVIANTLKIKTTSFIFSWDNLASKGRMLGEFDYYLVWSELMKKELLNVYPKTIKNNISIVGTPQFEPYVLENYQTDKIKFAEKFKLNINKRIICYSCADADIGRNDEIHIRAVWSYIENNPSQKLQLLVRTSPAEDGKRFEKLKQEIPEIKWNFPKWFLSRKNHVETWSQRIPTIEDVIDLKSILKYSDVNVNMLSTMSLDFMLFDKPVVNTVFGNKQNGLYNDQKFLNYVHYKYVVDSQAVTIAKNKEELFMHLNEALEKPTFRKDYRKKILDLEIGKPIEGTSTRIVAALKKM